jgi:hypothetical protein
MPPRARRLPPTPGPIAPTPAAASPTPAPATQLPAPITPPRAPIPPLPASAPPAPPAPPAVSPARPRPLPVDERGRDASALLVVDVQQDAPGAAAGAPACLPRLLDLFRAQDLPVLHVLSRYGPPACVSLFWLG